MDDDEKPGYITKEQAKIRLDCSARTLNRLVAEGELTLVTDDSGNEWLDADEVTELKETGGHKPAKRDKTVEQLSKSLKDANDAIHRLIGLVTEPIRQTQETLLRENESLRQERHKTQELYNETQMAYFELMKVQLEAEAEAVKEEANKQMREEGLAMLRDKVVPMIADNMASKKLVSSIDDVQLEALIEGGILDARQTQLVALELQRRKKAREQHEQAKQQQAGKEEKEARRRGASNASGGSTN